MKGLIFDLDDTLYPRYSYVQSGFMAVAQHISMVWRRDPLALLDSLHRAYRSRHTGREFQIVCAEHRLPMSVIPALVDVFHRHRPAIRLDDGVPEVLGALRADGWRLVIATNGNPAVQRRKVNALGVEPLVDWVIYGEEHAAAGKPDAAVFRAAIEMLRVPIDACVHVGDDPYADIAGAQAHGVRAILVTGHRRNARTMAQPLHKAVARPDAVVASVVEVPLVAQSLLEGEARRVA